MSPAPSPTAPSWLVEVAFAHRGLHGPGVPENSLPAFVAAAEAGYGVELDVQLSRDGVPVVIHDPLLRRLTGAAGRVVERTAEQLGRLRLEDTDATVPTLEDALAVLGDVPVMVEAKQPRPRAGRLEQAVASVLDAHPGAWCVAGFNPSTGRWFRRWRPEAIRVLTATGRPAAGLWAPVGRRFAALRDLPSVAPHAVGYDLASLPSPATDRWRAAGGVLLAWTAVGDAEVARARELADNVIFEGARP